MPDLEYISNCLEGAKAFGLEAEVVWAALQAMKSDPSMSIDAAMLEGMNEWIK